MFSEIIDLGIYFNFTIVITEDIVSLFYIRLLFLLLLFQLLSIIISSILMICEIIMIFFWHLLILIF